MAEKMKLQWSAFSPLRYKRNVLLGVLIGAFQFLASTALGASMAAEGTGINVHFLQIDEHEADLLKSSGVKYIRTDLRWGRIERTRGVYDFAEYDAIFDLLNSRDFKFLLILDFSNPIYESEKGVPSSERQTAYIAWAVAAVQRYKHLKITWEFGNEPNLDEFWKPSANPDEYCPLLKAAASAVRTASPDATLIAPGLAKFDLKYFRRCLDFDILKDLNGISVHPYREDSPDSVISDYKRLRDLIAQTPHLTRCCMIFSSEWGYTTTWSGIDQRTQAEYLVRQWVINASQAIEISIWYDWRDDGIDPLNGEHHFGLIAYDYIYDHSDLTQHGLKPAYFAAQFFNSKLRDAIFKTTLNSRFNDLSIYQFQKNDNKFFVIWNSKGDSEIEVNMSALGCHVVGAWDYIGLYLNVSENPTSDALMRFGASPIYVECR